MHRLGISAIVNHHHLDGLVFVLLLVRQASIGDHLCSLQGEGRFSIKCEDWPHHYECCQAQSQKKFVFHEQSLQEIDGIRS